MTTTPRPASAKPKSARPLSARSRRARLSAALDRNGRRESLRDASRAFVLSRLLVGVIAVLAPLNAVPVTNPLAAQDLPQVSRPFGELPASGFLDRTAGTLSRWDAIWYLAIAREGYHPGEAGAVLSTEARSSFFPMYPSVVRAVSFWDGSGAAAVIAAELTSLACLFCALFLLHRLVLLDAGRNVARATVMLLAFFPTSFVFSAPYTEGLFLLLTVGALYAARTGRWWVAGLAGAAASATRNTGVLLLAPLALIALETKASLRRVLPALALVPLGLAAFAWHLDRLTGDPLAWMSPDTGPGAQRELVGPLAGFWRAVSGAGEAAWDFVRFGADPYGLQHEVLPLLMLLGCLVAAAWLAWQRRFAYAAWVAVLTLVPLSAPDPVEPLQSFPRFVLVMFPVFICLAELCERRRITSAVVGASAVLLGLFTAQFASWQWVV